VSPGFYRLTGTLRVRKPLTLLGDGLLAGSELRQTSAGSPGFIVQSSDVTFDGLRLMGPRYSSYSGATAIYIRTSDSNRLTNVNVVNSWIQSWSNSAIRWSFVNDFIIQNNHIEDVTYAGIMVISGYRGLIADNFVVDVGDPETGSPLNNAYSIAVTSYEGLPYSGDIIIRDNVVRKSPIWAGIMNHGGFRVLVDSNEVYDADFAYANTWTEGAQGSGSDHTLFINNYAENAPRNSLWLVGDDNQLTEEAQAIGNRFSNSASMVVYNQNNATITWNSATGTVGSNGALWTRRVNRQLTVANNDWGGASVTSDGSVLTFAPDAVAPASPSNLTAQRNGSRIILGWSYGSGNDHDSFLIQHRVNGGSWQVLDYRPPNDGTWSFDAPTNPSWVTFNALSHTVEGIDSTASYQFRIRAQLGSATSPWSNTATP